MSEFILACVSLDEVQIVIADLLQPLFPGTNGVVYLMNNSKDRLDAIATWVNSHSKSNFDPEECWAIRRGNYNQADFDTARLYCSHIDTDTDSSSTLCLLMIAKGQTIGMLHLSNDSQTISQSIQRAKTVAQNLAMSVANLRLQQKLKY